MRQEFFGLIPYGSGHQVSGADTPLGRLERKMEFTWWVKIKTEEGAVGWTKHPENFSNKDACG